MPSPQEIEAAYRNANSKFRNQKVSGLLSNAKGDPAFEQMAPDEVAEQVARDNQQAQAAQADVRRRVTESQTVQHNDQAALSGQPAFVQTSPDDQIPDEGAPVRQPGQVFVPPQRQRARAAREGEVIEDKQAFTSPQQQGIDIESVAPGIAQVRRTRDVSDFAASMGIKPMRPAEAPRRADDVQSEGLTETVPITPYEVNPYVVGELNPDDAARVSIDEPSPYIPDLVELVVDHAKSLGKKKAAEYFGTTQMVVTQWLNGVQVPNIRHLTQVLNDPDLQESKAVHSAKSVVLRCDPVEGDHLMTTERPKLPVMIAMAIERPMFQSTHWAMMYMEKRYDVNYAQRTDTLVVRARNALVDQFLNTDNQYIVFIDSDMVPPIGDPDWFLKVTGWKRHSRAKAGFDTIPRLLSWNKDMVGGVYAGRSLGMPMIIQPDLNPRPNTNDKEMANRIRQGQSKGLMEVDWLATGCFMIHRKVFEAIKKRFPNLAPKYKQESWGFFNQDGNAGEDVSFCRRARACGFKCYLDTELVLGHIGNWAFGPEHSGLVSPDLVNNQ